MIYLHNSPAGSFTLELEDSSGVIMSKSFSSSDVKTASETTDNYLYSFYPVIPTSPVRVEKGSYTLRIKTSGYTATGSSFIGWIQQHEDIQNTMSYNPSNDSQNPLAFRVKIYKEGIKCR